MSRDRYRCVSISDFNIRNLDAYLQNDETWPQIECVETPYGQVAQLLLDAEADAWQEGADFALVWTRPEGVIDSFRRLVDGEAVSPESILADVDDYVQALLSLKGRVALSLVSLWTLPPDRRNHALVGLNDAAGVDRMLLRMNLRLLDGLSGERGFYALDAPRWAAAVGSDAFSPKLWTMGKIPYSNALFREAVLGIKGALRGIAGRSRKLLVVDLDGTLWGGIVGDDGKENLRLGGHDPVGEAYADFQKALRRLARRGVLLGIVSKNEASVALDAIETHPEMALRLEDFAGWRIDWGDKAQNLMDLASELNLGLESVVFLDDNPIERARVREALPEVLVPEWPKDRAQYARALDALGCFDVPTLSAEDRDRSKLYASERKRGRARASFPSLDRWLETLDTVVTWELLHEADLPRAAQLLNKTNQMNLTTRRMSESEFWRWARDGGHRVWTFRVADKMGDLGLVGILSLVAEGPVARILDFVLSCRAMGRRIEETMISIAVAHAKRAGLDEVIAEPIATAKNKPCLRFWNESDFERDDESRRFRWQTERPYEVPKPIRLVAAEDAS